MYQENEYIVLNDEANKELILKQVEIAEDNKITVLHEMVEGDMIEVNSELLIDSYVLPHMKFAKKNFHYKNKIFKFLHLPKWKMFGIQTNVYLWLD